MKENSYNFILLGSIFLLITLIGGGLNWFVVLNNDGKMPVKVDYPQDNMLRDYDRHFEYSNPEEVKYPFFTDIITIKTKVYSIGDFIMIFAIIGYSGVIIFNIYQYQWKTKKN